MDAEAAVANELAVTSITPRHTCGPTGILTLKDRFDLDHKEPAKKHGKAP